MTAAPSRRALNRAARVSAILDAALSVFSKDGFSGATMAAVAARAGISKPTLYQYFPNKTDLFDAMMQARRKEMMLAIETANPDDMVPQLYRFSVSYAQVVMRDDMLSLARLIIGEAQRFPQIGRAYQAAGPDQLLSGIRDFLTSQKRAGRLHFDDVALAADDLWGLILSAPRNRALHDPDIEFTPLQLRGYVLNGLRVFLKAYSPHSATDIAALDAYVFKGDDRTDS